ncbi:MAG: selenocysteine-specific translation elongation factor [Planctomycetota bacterium]|nr:selenocysteine-specific translation elongation factor [Planctomycetota bacterium]
MESNDLILGTAGHIDHGKTSLIRALTGVDTDRLPEEQKRGITIELGFAHLEVPPHRFGVVDVPGHERFVRNMLAGATGMDAVLLVVAADDSIKQQTREHLEILKLLRLPCGVIALTKCDLVDEDWLDLVEEEVRDMVTGTCLADAPIVRTSAVTGSGLDELRQALKCAAANAIQVRNDSRFAPFRMAIDRTFTIAGHGTVVTGSVVSGATKTGDELEIVPGRIKVRVRGIQNHDQPTTEVHRGQRAAINLVGIHHNETRRGHELIFPNSLEESKRLLVRLHYLEEERRTLRKRSRIRLHLGTTEQLATLTLLDCEGLEPGEKAYAQIILSEPVVAGWKQPFVVRSESPVRTIGGGLILDPNAAHLKSHADNYLESLGMLEDAAKSQRVEAAIRMRGWQVWGDKDLFRLTGVEEPREAIRQLIADGSVVVIELSPQRSLRIHRDTLQSLAKNVERLLDKLHKSEPLRLVFPLSEIAKRFEHLPDRKILNTAIGLLKKAHLLRSTQHGIGLQSCGPKLSQNEVKLFDQLVKSLEEVGLTGPTVKQIESSVTKNKDSVKQLLQLAAGQGDLVEITTDYYVHHRVFEEAWSKLEAAFREQGGMKVSSIREILGFSRKYAVPFCEYLDRAGWTRREGDLRYSARTSEIS